MRGWTDLVLAECIKLKRSLALGLVVAAPLLTAFLFFLVLLKGRPGPAPAQDPWGGYTQSALMLWSFLALPMLATLLATLVNGVEHQNGQWKHLFAQPVPRWRILFVKAALTLALLGLSCALLIPFIALFGKSLVLLRPGLGFQSSLPLRAMAMAVARPFLAAWFMLAIQQWISTRWAGVALSIGSGMLGLIGAFVVVNSKTWGSLYPWCLPLRAAQPGTAGDVLILGCLGGLAVWALALWDGSRRT